MEVRGGGHASHLTRPPAPEPPPPAPPRAPNQALLLQPGRSRGGPFSSGPSEAETAGRIAPSPREPRQGRTEDEGRRRAALQPLSPELGCGSRFSAGSQLWKEACFLLRSLHQGLVAPRDEVQPLAWLARLPGTQRWPASPASSPRLSEVGSIEACPHPTVSLPKPSRLPLVPKASPSLRSVSKAHQTWNPAEARPPRQASLITPAPAGGGGQRPAFAPAPASSLPGPGFSQLSCA